MLKNNLHWIAEALVIVGVIAGIWWFVETWSETKDREYRERIEDFCGSFLDKNSTLYGRCMDRAVNYF